MTFKEAENLCPGFTAYMREEFVSNECDTDEYREAQPAKGLGMIADLATVVDMDHSLLSEVRDWLNIVIAGDVRDYDGAEELKPILYVYFDALAAVGRHPYYGDAVEEALDASLSAYVEQRLGS